MATVAQLDLVPDTETGTDIAVVVANTPVVVLIDQQKRSDLYDHIRREIEAFTPDVSTAKGRDAIKSFAYKITRTKTAIDAAGKQLNEEARAKIAVVDEARRDARNTLDIMAAQVRKPLTEWEEAETARVSRCREIIDAFKADAVVTLDDTAATVRARGAGIWQIVLDEEQFRDLLPEAQQAKDHAVATLKTALARLEKEEADRAELERLRAENEAREARERAEAAKRERVEAERRAEEERVAREAEEARLAEERRVAAEKAEAARIERARAEAAEAERLRVEREHAEQIAAERRRAEEAERAAQAERDRIAAAEAERQAEAKRLADEQAAREADQAHRSAVMKAAKEAIMTCGVDEETARKVVLLIRAGEVPHVTLGF